MDGLSLMDLKQLIAAPQTREAIKRFSQNYIAGKPFVASLLVTEECQADCDFCSYRRSNTKRERTKPIDSYVEALRPLNLPFLSIVGGEPLMRKDLSRIIRESKQENRIPYVQAVTNAGLLTQGKYKELEEAGLDGLVISLDFASTMHSTERGIKNLYERIAGMLPKLNGRTQVRLNAILMRDNLIRDGDHTGDVQGIVEFAERYGVRVSFGAYSPHRNGNDAHLPQPADRAVLEQTVKYLLEVKAKRGTITSTVEYLKKAGEFLKGNEIGNCQAGKRFLWISPDGKYMPCNDYPQYTYGTPEDARSFPVARTCTACYAECRGLPEQLASRNLIKVAKVGIGFSDMVTKEP
ncbi:radical SAM protein [Candidatus Woesearchaeota archaeon]|nr:radical SAM protein [Candidatus Woesearchaeota archaeon]